MTGKIKNRRYILIDEQAAPEIFLKVVSAKAMIKQGTAKNSSEACKISGLSRSAFYKYKDSVFLYEENKGRIITLYMNLRDEPGILSSVLSSLYESNANIITVNQNIPDNGVAAVTVSLRINNKKTTSEEIINLISQLRGVIEVRTI